MSNPDPVASLTETWHDPDHLPADALADIVVGLARTAPASVPRLDADPTARTGLPHRRVVIVCDEGYASSLAAAALRDLGLTSVTDLDGGYQAWRALQFAPDSS
jgi:rhodanese-related sulfurtransferase